MSNVIALRDTISKMEDQFKKALPSHIRSDRFTRVMSSAIMNAPDLADCNRQSVLASCMKFAEAGLMPDGREGALVKFGNSCKPMFMVSGLMKLVRNSGELLSLDANPVYANDEFSYKITNNGPALEHTPCLEESGDFKLVYAIARTRDGGVYIEVMKKAEIDKVRGASRSGGKGPWDTWFDQMAVKSVIRRLYKKLPSSTDLDSAVYADDDLYDFNPEPEVKPPVDVTPKNAKAPSKLQAAMDEDDEKVDADEEIPI